MFPLGDTASGFDWPLVHDLVVFPNIQYRVQVDNRAHVRRDHFQQIADTVFLGMIGHHHTVLFREAVEAKVRMFDNGSVTVDRVAVHGEGLRTPIHHHTSVLFDRHYLNENGQRTLALVVHLARDALGVRENVCPWAELRDAGSAGNKSSGQRTTWADLGGSFEGSGEDLPHSHKIF